MEVMFYSLIVIGKQKKNTVKMQILCLCLGEVLTSTQWMLSIEGRVVMGLQPNFLAGISALFSSYYNFNLVYQEHACYTLEFIQR